MAETTPPQGIEVDLYRDDLYYVVVRTRPKGSRYYYTGAGKTPRQRWDQDIGNAKFFNYHTEHDRAYTAAQRSTTYCQKGDGVALHLVISRPLTVVREVTHTAEDESASD